MIPPADDDIMLSPTAFEHGGVFAGIVLDLFLEHHRRAFRPDHDAYCERCPTWRGRGSKQRFDRAIHRAICQGFLTLLPDGRCRITTRKLMTGREFKRRFPNASQANGLWRPN